MQPGRARTNGPGVPLLPLARWVGWVAPVRPTHGVLVLSCPSAALRVCSVLGHLAPVHRCARVVLWCCVCGVLGHLAPVHRCARSVCCVACAVSWATWLPSTGALAGCVVLRVRCPGPLGSCSPVRPPGVLCCVCGVLGHLAPVNRCARSVGCFACAVSWASSLQFIGVPVRFVVLRVRCPGPLGSCSPVRLLGVLCCVGGVLGHLALVHRCARSVCCVACSVSWAFVFFSGGPRRFWCCAWVWVCAGAGACVGVGVVGDGGRVAVALWVPCVCAGPKPSVSRAPVLGVLMAGGWRQWWRGACVGGRGSWVVPGWRGRARACVWLCSWRGLMGWWAVWAWLVCVGVG